MREEGGGIQDDTRQCREVDQVDHLPLWHIPVAARWPAPDVGTADAAASFVPLLGWGWCCCWEWWCRCCCRLRCRPKFLPLLLLAMIVIGMVMVVRAVSMMMIWVHSMITMLLMVARETKVSGVSKRIQSAGRSCWRCHYHCHYRHHHQQNHCLTGHMTGPATHT